MGPIPVTPRNHQSRVQSSFLGGINLHLPSRENLTNPHLRKAGGNHRRRIWIVDMLLVRRAHDLKVTANTTENRRNLPQKGRKLYSKHPFSPKCEFQGRVTSNAWYKMGPQKPVRKVGKKITPLKKEVELSPGKPIHLRPFIGVPTPFITSGGQSCWKLHSFFLNWDSPSFMLLLYLLVGAFMRHCSVKKQATGSFEQKKGVSPSAKLRRFWDTQPPHLFQVMTGWFLGNPRLPKTNGWWFWTQLTKLQIRNLSSSGAVRFFRLRKPPRVPQKIGQS